MTEKLKGIAGSMFAGKTDILITEARRCEYRKKNVLVFKPVIDNRWGGSSLIKSHSGQEFPAIPVSTPMEILETVKQFISDGGKIDLVGIDEIQFFTDEIVDVIKVLLEADIKVIFAGLSTDFRGEPFGSMPNLLSLSDEIIRPTAVCEICGDEATRTQRLNHGHPANYSDPLVVIGDHDQYQARCPSHHEVPGKPKPKIK